MRGYNDLSARSLAYFLAEQKNPEAALCPHESLVPDGGNASESLKLSKGKRSASGRDRNAPANGHAIHGLRNGHVVTPDAAPLSPSRRRRSNSKRELGIHGNQDTLVHAENVGEDKASSLDAEPTQPASKISQQPDQPFQQAAAAPEDAQGSDSSPPKRDHNSFSQNLFNTLSLRLSEWFAPTSNEDSSPASTKHEESATDVSPPRNGTSQLPSTYNQVDGQDETVTSLSPRRNKHNGPNGHNTSPLRASLSRSGTLSLSSTQGNNKVLFEKDREVRTDASNRRKSLTTPAPFDLAQKPWRNQKENNVGLPLPPTNNLKNDGICPRNGLESRPAATDFVGNATLVEDQQADPKKYYPDTTDAVRAQEEQSITELEVPSLSEINDGAFWNLYYLQKASENTVSQWEISLFLRQSLFYCLKDPLRLARSFRQQTVDVKWLEDGRIDLPPLNDIKDKWPPSGLLCDLRPTYMRTIFSGIFALNLAAGGAPPSYGTCLPYDVLSDISLALNACALLSGALRSPRSASSSRSGDRGGSRMKIGRKASGTKVLHDVATSAVTKERYPQGVTDDHAASTCVIALHALSEYASMNGGVGNFNQAWLFNDGRADGFVAPPRRHHFYAPEMDYDPHELTDFGYSEFDLQDAKISHAVSLGDAFDDLVAQNLLSKLVTVISIRWTRWEIIEAQKPKSGTRNVMQILMAYMAYDAQQRVEHHDRGNVERAGLLSRLTLCWLRTLMLRDWDGKPVINRAGTVGTIIRMLAAMYEGRLTVLLNPVDFWTPLFERRLDMEHMPFEWLQYRSDNKTLHLLQYSFLFPPHVIVECFRAINFKTMSDRFEKATNLERAAKQFERLPHIQVAKPSLYGTGMLDSMKKYLVLDVSRGHPLTDAINSLWRRNKQDLLKPLKVYMGHGDGGEEGHDVGGVQQEFFRIVLGQAFDPAYGMFTVDEKTMMTWFQPESYEPLYKFEMLGVLMSLAIYNAITLPITFPLAFYRKLLGLKVKKLDHITDGWPDLARGMQTLLDWKDGDVGDVFTRSYAFSYEAFGRRMDIDMKMVSRDSPWPLKRLRDFPINKGMLRAQGKGSGKTTSFADQREGDPDLDDGFGREASRIWRHKDPSIENELAEEPLVPPFAPATPPENIADEEAGLVTNANREDYVKDYIFWLTDKSVRQEYEAFANGFYTCLDRTALSIFTPEALKSVVEGIQEIDVDALFSVTVYDGWTSSEHIGRAVMWFWAVFRAWPAERHRQFLEFVTACDRLPVNGVEGLKFSIQRDGVDDRRLPTSSTCFGTLLLPDYSSKEILQERLEKAIQEGRGFGNV